MTPWERYQADLKKEDFQADPAQEQAVEHLQALYDELLAAKPAAPAGKASLLSRVLRRNETEAITPVRGLYFWGGVGRGKTYLIDSFYEALPFAEKRRLHFHRFMHKVHRELRSLKDTANPLDVVAERFAADVRVLCFDEFHVSDITDAMLLYGLLKALFDRGVTLVTTSNQAPDDLYSGGLQRERFLPAIDLIKEHTRVLNVDHGIDYRLRVLEQADVYHTPHDSAAQTELEHRFGQLAPDAVSLGSMLEIEGRPIETVRLADGVLWCQFSSLCDGPRGAADYIEIAREFQTVFVSDIPVLTGMDDDRARRLMTLVDELYDRNVKLVITAADEPDALYTGQRLAEPFKRTVSRLQEMRSHDYLARPHLP